MYEDYWLKAEPKSDDVPVTKKGKLYCRFCDRAFFKSRNFTYHILMTHKRQFRCTVCSLEMPTAAALSKHATLCGKGVACTFSGCDKGIPSTQIWQGICAANFLDIIVW